MKGFWKIYRISLAYKWTAFLVVFYNLLFVIFNLLSLVLFIPFLELIFRDNKEGIVYVSKPILRKDWSNFFSYCGKLYEFEMQQLVNKDPKFALFFVCMTVLVAFLLKGLFRYLAIYYHSFIKAAVVRDMRRKLFGKALRLPMSFYTEERKGDLMARINNDVGEFEFASQAMLELIFREPIAIILSLGMLIYISPELTLFSLVLLPVSAFIISRIGKSLKRTAKQGQEQMGVLLSTLEENFGGMRVIKAFDAEKYIKKTFEAINERHRFLVTKTYRKKDLSSPLNEVLGSMVMIGLVWFGGSMILDGHKKSDLTGPEFVTFIIVFSQLLRPIQGIATSISIIQKAQVSYVRYEEIMRMQEETHETEDPVLFGGLEKGISFHNVSFRYGEEWVLRDLSFHIPKGKMFALVGESGSGKSTVADLILKFYHANEGQILFDDIGISHITNSDLRKEISVVNQESILFNDTVRSNIAFGLENCSEEKIIEAAKIAHAHDFIMNLESGYDTRIGERGNKLSGGQKQRISIARAILRDPSILILDEATSALDSESEKNVHAALESLMKNRTSLVIAHRLSTIKNADCILVLQKGRIIEQGNHGELLRQNGYYANMYSMLLAQ